MDALIFWTAGVLLGLLCEYLILGQLAPNPDNRRLTNILYGVFAAITAFISGVATVAIIQALPNATLVDLSGEKSWICQIGLGLGLAVLADLPYYLWHRAQHKFAILWKIHKVHHGDNGFDVTTYVRQHWLEEPFQALLIGLPLALLVRLGTPGYVAYAIFVNAIVFGSHFARPFRLGPLTGLITGPELHKTHHSQDRSWSNANYASITPLWDRIFGTYKPPVQYLENKRQKYKKPFEKQI